MSLADRTAPTIAEYEQYRERFSNWGRWGEDDQLGTLNHIGADVRRRALALAREGRSVSCAAPLATAAVLPDSWRNPRPADHRVTRDAGGCADYIGVDYHGFANTHLDALCHIFTMPGGTLYGGRAQDTVTPTGARTLGIDRWRDGIMTRGVLYDVPRSRRTRHVTLEEPVHGWELDQIADASGFTPQPGDAVLIRAGAGAFWADAAAAGTPPWQAPGVHASVLEFLYRHDAALLGWDLMEAGGQDYPAHALPIHSIAIPCMGMPLLDNADFDALAATCEQYGRWEFLFVIAPLVVIGGTGSPVNPLAVF